MRPRICPTCTAAEGGGVRHSARRRCSQVLAQRRYARTEKGRKANAAAVAAFRARKKTSDAS